MINHLATDALIPALLMARELGGGGGIERDVSKFARHLTQYGIAPHVACFNPGGARWREIEAAGIPVLPVRITSFTSRSVLSGISILRRYVAEHDIQVLHAFDLTTDLLGVPLARMLGIPVALSSQLWCRNILPMRRRLLLAVVDRIATGLFVNCRAVADDLVLKWKVPIDRIYLCHNGFESHEFHPDGRKRPAQLADGSVVIGTVAVLREEKNISLLIEAFAQVRSIDRRAYLLIVGDGPMKPALEQQARDMNIADACIFQEATPNPASWMRSMDVFVVPSRSEAFPNALLEAMACGCCPVASSVGGIPELVHDGQSGLLFKAGDVQQLADALCTLARDPVRCERMAHEAVRFVSEHLTIDVAASRLAFIYKDLLRQAS